MHLLFVRVYKRYESLFVHHTIHTTVLAVVRRSQIFSPHRRPPSWGCRTAKFNLLEMVTAFTYKPSLVRFDAHNFKLSW